MTLQYRGWQKHAITRMVGKIASTYNSGHPFFEVLINSARSSEEGEICKPFAVTIHNNERVLDDRRKNLAAMRMLPSKLAHFTFYASYLKNPKNFLDATSLKVGPNSRRILEGLTYLEDKELKAQSVGNCWIKQPMRALLVSLFLEHFSTQMKLTPDEGWK